jgi:hypothetical protein
MRFAAEKLAMAKLRWGKPGLALLSVAMVGVVALAQGTGTPNPAPAAGTKAAHSAAPAKSRKRAHVVKPAVQPEPQAVTPPPPDWPVNDKAVPASVDWNGRVLRISATNSSLQQILSDISTATGVKVEGAATDQRIYGSYGPAPARDVLSELLDGSGYNVLMVGDQGEGTPRTLVLTTKVNGPAPNTAANSLARQGADDDAEEPEQPEQPDPNFRRPPGLQPGQNRPPQQIMQELEQRRLQMQQQQQQGTPVTPPVPIQPNNE